MTLGVALVTGASRGIGRAIALRLAADGFNVVINDIPAAKEGLDDLEAEIKRLGREAVIYIADVTREDEVQAMIETAVSKLGGLDVMVANAGICIPKPFLETTLDDWDQMFNVNGKGVYLCYKHAAIQMVKQGKGGRIIGASSIAGKQGSRLMAIYSATKFAVRSLTQCAAAELAKFGITVNAYAPGFIQTPMMDQFARDTKQWGVPDTAFDNVGTPEEVAALVSYLASKEARHITGQSININGGRFFD